MLWDGRVTSTFRKDLQRRRTAVIFQDFVRYAFTAEENIAISRPEEPRDLPAVRQAAQVADADGFLSHVAFRLRDATVAVVRRRPRNCLAVSGNGLRSPGPSTVMLR